MTHQCCNKPVKVGDWPFSCDGTGDHKVSGGLKIASIHTSERATVYVNPRTGERRIPGRNDQVMPQVYARQGYERVELDTGQKLHDFEKKTGLVHEPSNFDVNTGSAERSLLTNV